MCVDAYPIAGRELEAGDFADGERPVTLDVFGGDAELDGVCWRGVFGMSGSPW